MCFVCKNVYVNCVKRHSILHDEMFVDPLVGSQSRGRENDTLFLKFSLDRGPRRRLSHVELGIQGWDDPLRLDLLLVGWRRSGDDRRTLEPHRIALGRAVGQDTIEIEGQRDHASPRFRAACLTGFALS